MIVIGVTAVGSGVGQAVLRALSFSDLDHRVIGMELAPTNSGIHWTDRSYLVPPVSDTDAYRERLLEIVRREGIDLLIPGTDTELPLLAELADDLLAIGCAVLVSPANTVTLSVDKLATWQWCAERGLPFVETITLTEARRDAGSLDYPRVLKPRSGSASVGARLVHGPDELLALTDSDEWIVQPYLAPIGLEAATGSAPAAPSGGAATTPPSGGAIEQSGEVSAQYLIGPSGNILGHFVSLNRLKDGVPIEILPVPHEPWTDDGLAIARALAAEGARGPINLQGRRAANGRVLFFELNARFTGITGVRTMMGFREVEAAVRAFALGDEDAARDRLTFDDRFLGTRHVGDLVVDRARVSQLAEAGEYPVAVGRPLPSRILVTGAGGYIAASTIARLLETTDIAEIHALVRSAESRDALLARHADPRLRVLVADLLAPDLELPETDAVVHLAALRFDGPALYETNVEGTRRLVLAARRAGAGRFILLSSQAVYGTRRAPLWGEGLPPRPETAYATSKWMSELAASEPIAGEMETLVLRAGRAYGLGPGMRWSELPHLFAERAVAGEPLMIDGDGSQRMDLVHVSDLARAVECGLGAALPPGRTVVNVGGGHPVSLLELARLYDTAIEFRPAGDAPDFGLNIRRARALLGWSPQVSLADAVAELTRAAAER